MISFFVVKILEKKTCMLYVHGRAHRDARNVSKSMHTDALNRIQGFELSVSIEFFGVTIRA